MRDSLSIGQQTLAVTKCLDLLRAGDPSVRGELLNLTQDRLLRLTAKMKRDFRGVGRWEQTEDIYQNAAMRLHQALSDTVVQDTRHFFRLAALQIRRELIDMCRHHRGPHGHGRHHATQGGDDDGEQRDIAIDPGGRSQNPADLHAWTDFHQCVEDLPAKEREVFELLWYHELKQDEAAELLDVSTRSIKRTWRSARLMLHDRLSDSSSQSIAF